MGGLASKIVDKQQEGGMRDNPKFLMWYIHRVFIGDKRDPYSVQVTHQHQDISSGRSCTSQVKTPSSKFPNWSWSLHFIWVTHAHSKNGRAHPGSNQKWEYLRWCHPLCKWGLGQPHMHYETVFQGLAQLAPLAKISKNSIIIINGS